MRKRFLAVAVSFLVACLSAQAKEPVSKSEATAFLNELIAEVGLPKDAQREFARSHPALGVSFTEASRAGQLTFVLREGDSPDLGKPATADWYGVILQDQTKVFGFRLRRNPSTNTVELFHFWTIGVPKGLKEIRGYII